MSSSKISEYIAPDGTISLYQVGAVVETHNPTADNANRYKVRNVDSDSDSIEVYDLPINYPKWFRIHNGKFVLVSVPDNSALSPMHAPVCVEVWYHQSHGSGVLLRAYHNSITAALEDAVSQLDGYGLDFSIKVTSAGGKYDILDCECGSEFHNGMIEYVNIRLEDYPDGEENDE